MTLVGIILIGIEIKAWNILNISPMSSKLKGTYPHLMENWGITTIFEIDIMKKSSPLNLKFTLFATVKIKITLFFSVKPT